MNTWIILLFGSLGLLMHPSVPQVAEDNQEPSLADTMSWVQGQLRHYGTVRRSTSSGGLTGTVSTNLTEWDKCTATINTTAVTKEVVDEDEPFLKWEVTTIRVTYRVNLAQMGLTPQVKHLAAKGNFGDQINQPYLVDWHTRNKQDVIDYVGVRTLEIEDGSHRHEIIEQQTWGTKVNGDRKYNLKFRLSPKSSEEEIPQRLATALGYAAKRCGAKPEPFSG